MHAPFDSAVFIPSALIEQIVIGGIGGLFALVTLLLGYALVLRVSYNRRNAYAKQRVREWEPLVLEYLEQESFEPSRFSLKPRDWMIFSEFIDEYLENLEGTENEKLLDLLRAVRLERLLMKQARGRNRWRRAYAVRYLGRMRYRPAAGLFLSMLGHRSSVVAFSALEGLQMLGISLDYERIIREVLRREDLSFPKISEVISRFGAPVHPSLIRLLDDPEISASAKRLVVDILADNRVVESAPSILGLLRETRDEELVIGCIKALGILEEPEALPTLTNYLTASNWIVRSQTVRAIGALGTKREVPVLAGMLRRDSSFWVKQYCADSLVRMGQDGVEMLRNMRQESSLSPEVESIVAHALEEKNGE